MPYLAVSTNAVISTEVEKRFLKEASETVAAITGKPEQYVMVKLDAAQAMLFAGMKGPAAFLELKSIGFPSSGAEGIATVLCGLASKHLNVPEERIFIVFQDVKPAMWGQGGEMFG